MGGVGREVSIFPAIGGGSNRRGQDYFDTNLPSIRNLAKVNGSELMATMSNIKHMTNLDCDNAMDR